MHSFICCGHSKPGSMVFICFQAFFVCDHSAQKWTCWFSVKPLTLAAFLLTCWLTSTFEQELSRKFREQQIGESLTHELHKPWTMRIKCFLGNRKKIIVVCDRIDMKTRRALKGFQRKKISWLSIKRNITKLTKTVYPEYHWVITFMVYAFYMVNVSSIRCKQHGP